MTSGVPLGALCSWPIHLAAFATRVFTSVWRRSVLLGVLLGLLLAAAATLLLLLLAPLLLKLPFSQPQSTPPPRSHPRIYRIYPQASSYRPHHPPGNTSLKKTSNHTNHTHTPPAFQHSSCTTPQHGSPAMQAASTACATNKTQAEAQQAQAAPHLQLVPYALWQTFRTSPLPSRAQAAVDSWRRLNPALAMHLQTDQDAEAFVAAAFDNETLSMYRGFPLGVMRADFWRYAILHAKGGIYSDVDVQCKRPVQEWLPPRDSGAAGLPLESTYNTHSWTNCSVVIGLENDVHLCQWAYAATAGHPLLAAVLDTIVKLARGGIDTSYPHFVHMHTGPGVWTEAIRAFFNFSQGSSAKDMFTAVYSDPAWYRLVVEQYRVCLMGRDFFNTLNVENLYGSTSFPDGQEGWVSWTQAQDRLTRGRAGRML